MELKSQYRAAGLNPYLGSNRTFMELKSRRSLGSLVKVEKSSNRTFMELKLRFRHINSNLKLSSNRTFMELKLLGAVT